MRRIFNHRPKRTLRIESMEARRLFHGEPIVVVQPSASELAAEQALNVYEWFNASSVGSRKQQLEKFGSEAAAQEQLTDWAVNFWSDIFGEELKADRWLQNIEFPQTFNTFNVMSTSDMLTSDAAWLTASSFDIGMPSLTINRVFDRTNIQLAGVDEHDIVEFSSDGFMYVSQFNTIKIYDTRDVDDIKLVSTIDQATYSSGLYLRDDRLISVGYSNAVIYDVSDKSSPKVLSHFGLSGSIQSSRMIDGSLILVTQESFALPRPKFLPANMGSEATNQANSNLLGRFETREEYSSRVSPTIVASFLSSVDNGSDVESIGTWEDLVVGTEGYHRQSVSVVVLDVDADTPKLLDSETVLGINANVTYADNNSLYIVDPTTDITTGRQIQSGIYRISLLEQGLDVVADAYGSVRGSIVNSRMMDEFENDLRVVTDFDQWDGSHSTNLYVLRETDGAFEEIGRLLDIADGQGALAAYFEGERAIVTTAEIQNFIPLVDPLHGIDLSDPTNPQELSELVIPGFATHLQWADNEHLIGVGYIEAEDGGWQRQVTLYDVADLAMPRVLANWTSDYDIVPDFQGNRLDPLSVSFDAATGVFLIAEESGEINQWGIGWDSPIDPAVFWPRIGRPWIVPTVPKPGVQVFRIDTESESSSLKHIGTIDINERARRGFVYEGSIIVVGDTKVVSASLEDFAKPNPVDPPIDQPQTPVFSDAHATVSLVATDDTGDHVTEVNVGDRVWIEVHADSDETIDVGVFQAIVAVGFDRSALRVVSAPESLDGFINGFVAIEDDFGFSELGGFNNSQSSIGAGPHRIIRFQVEVQAAGDFDLTVRPSDATDEAILLYGDNFKLRRENITAGSLRIKATEINNTVTESTDVNGDGRTSALDVLVILNHLNRMSGLSDGTAIVEGEQTNRLDVNRDNHVTAGDVLKIINQLNAEAESRLASQAIPPISAEGEANSANHDAVFAVLQDDDLRKKKAVGVNFLSELEIQ